MCLKPLPEIVIHSSLLGPLRAEDYGLEHVLEQQRLLDIIKEINYEFYGVRHESL